MSAYSDMELPIRGIRVSVKADARSSFFDKLTKFANEYAFAIRIAPVRPDTQNFSIQLWRADIKGIGVNTLSPEDFEIFFYNNSKQPVDPDAVAQIVDGLTHAVTQIEGVSVFPLTKGK